MKTTRMACVLSLAVFLSASLLLSQSAAPNKPPEFDHIAIHVRDLGKSVEFYEKVAWKKSPTRSRTAATSGFVWALTINSM